MDKRTEITRILHQQGVLPLYYHDDPGVTLEVAAALYRAGIRAVEYTNRGTHALRNFELLRSRCDQDFSGMYLGAGTIKEGAAARSFCEAGADFIISPGLAEDVYDITYSNKTLWVPGCMTVSEILKAEQFGLNLVKLFPASLLGPSFISSLKDVFPNMNFLPTGGVTTDKENLRSWFQAGAFAVGIGSQLLTKEIIAQKKYDAICTSTKDLISQIHSIQRAL
jgi:2-dehydro-3-deoxyphosphogluconate aldolase / (4S)-4-hydroxy-2-oxoglutarate aldolase